MRNSTNTTVNGAVKIQPHHCRLLSMVLVELLRRDLVERWPEAADPAARSTAVDDVVMVSPCAILRGRRVAGPAAGAGDRSIS
ncbi:hypothetical protein GCM10023216_32780 [Isoptericola chiayiensis]|uniref:Uncharacterized protein n=1 Tax=Isoptericola chiayiensis TaxID=579446 RepID=A0ABP8YW55_9MICO